jgi:formamidopyrimidine-DNA glycosylase
MPELPEVETVRRGLAPVMEGERFAKVEVRRGDLRWPLPKGFAQKLDGKTVQGLGRRAKYLLADLSSGDVLLMHLGMSGSFRVGKDSAPGKYYHERSKSTAHDHVIFHMSNGATVTFNDPRRFGSMKLVPRARLDEEPLLRSLGPEPLGNEFDAAMLAKACARKKTSLKAALSDQRVVAGLGNIYVCEALFRARLSPKRTASTIARKNSSMPSRRCSRMRSKPEGRRCGIIAAPTVRSATFNTISGSTIGKASRASPAKARSNGSCRAVARPSIAHRARSRPRYAATL